MRILSAFVMLTFMASCNSAPAEDSLQTSIEKMEVEIKQHAELDTAMARKLTDAYLEYAQLHPEDSIAPYYISRAAEIYKEMPGRALTAVVTYNKVITDYPDNPLAARSVFMIGFVFDDKLQDTARAAKSYSHFLKEYPNHPMAADARQLLQMLKDTISEEQMVKMWMEKSKTDTNDNK
jgi:outer membrane protein assembly factor BamD (BamD/ComL family)